MGARHFRRSLQRGDLFMAEHSEHIAVVTTAPNEMEAGIIVAALEREGIKATMSGAETSGFRVGVPGEVEILVAEKDLDRAQGFIEAAQDADESAEAAEDFDDTDDSDELD